MIDFLVENMVKLDEAIKDDLAAVMQEEPEPPPPILSFFVPDRADSYELSLFCRYFAQFSRNPSG